MARPSIPEHLTEEHEEMLKNVSILTLSWAHVENALVILFSKIIRDPPAALASAIYFSPSSLEARFKIVKSALSVVIRGHPRAERISSFWNTTVNKFGHLKYTRNFVAHGQITTHHYRGRNRLRLTAPMFQFAPFEESFEKRQAPGMSSGDLKKSTTAVRTLTKRITAMTSIVTHLRDQTDEALVERLLEAENQFRSEESHR